MRLQEVLRLRRNNAGAVPLEVLQTLGLPMPDDVLEQFVCDHGTKDDFQHQYGDLDLHAVEWKLIELPTSELLTCSIFPSYIAWIETARNRTYAVQVNGWENVCLPPGAAEHWQRYGTWKRPPVTVRGELVGSNRPLHLVEGHTRIGALKGLVESGVLTASSLHAVWVGEGCQSKEQGSQWREVLRKERMPFLDWLMKQVGDEGHLGALASDLIDAKYASYPKARLMPGDNLTTVLEFIKNDADAAMLEPVVLQAHAEWERLMNE